MSVPVKYAAELSERRIIVKNQIRLKHNNSRLIRKTVRRRVGNHGTEESLEILLA